jgi:hypothetical protein
MTAYINFVRIPKGFELDLSEKGIKELWDAFMDEKAFSKAKDGLEFLKNSLKGNIGMCEHGFNELNESLQIMDMIVYSMEIYGSDAGNIVNLDVLEKNIKASENIFDEENSVHTVINNLKKGILHNESDM